MAKSIEPKLEKIGSYLKLDKGVIFTIPEYQRAYSWGIEHCDKLWNDIVEYSESDKLDNYFFGTIIINCQDNDTKFDLIDGQQRTTTFFLLLKALLMRINIAIISTSGDEDSESLRRGLEERRRKIMGILYKTDAEDIPNMPDISKDEGICKGVASVDNKSINEQYKNDLNIILQEVEYSQIEPKVEKIPYKQKDNKYTNYFRNFKYFYEKAEELTDSKLNKITKTIIDKCEVIEIKSWQVEQAITMFNSLNSDGLPLFDADIISAQLFASAEQQKKKDEYIKLWEEFKTRVSNLEQKGIVKIDSILMQWMYCIRAQRGETVSDTGAIIVTTPGLRRYFTDINRKDLIDNPIELCKGLINLTKIWDKAASYPSVQVLLKFNENAKLFLAGYFYRFTVDEISEDKVSSIAKSLLKLFVIMELVDAGYSSKYFKTFLFGEETKLIDKTVDEDEIINDFSQHIANNWKKDEIENAISEYDKHLLVYLNEYLFSIEKGVSFDLGNKYDIEHIMPYSGSNIQIIRKDAKINDEKEFKEIVNKLGNKILLEERINRSIGNEWFRTKVSTSLKDKTGYIDSVYPIAQALVEEYGKKTKYYWTKKDINDATKKAAERITDFLFG